VVTRWHRLCVCPSTDNRGVGVIVPQKLYLMRSKKESHRQQGEQKNRAVFSKEREKQWKNFHKGGFSQRLSRWDFFVQEFYKDF
jgi:hypothetical protein